MARIRTIKPEFFTSEDIVSLTPLTRLFYVSLWCESDREGRLEWKPRTFKLRYFPGDNCDIDAMAQELVDSGLVEVYECDGKTYAEIPSFTKHQVINNRENPSDLPCRLPKIDAIAPTTSDRIPSGINIQPKLRMEIITRDGGACVRCGSTEDLTVDHIFPQSIGGTHATSNLRCLCRSCNAARPVNGHGLTDDLARDGYSMSDMARVCSDNPRVGTRESGVKAEGKGRERKGKEGREQREDGPPAAQPAPAPEKPKAQQASRLPADWQLPTEWGQWALSEQPSWTPDGVRRVADSFRDYWAAKGGADARKVDWQATWRNWVRREKSPVGSPVMPNRQEALEARNREVAERLARTL